MHNKVNTVNQKLSTQKKQRSRHIDILIYGNL